MAQSQWSCTQQVVARGTEVSLVIGFARKKLCESVRSEVSARKEEIEEAWLAADQDQSGTVDMSELRYLLLNTGILGADVCKEDVNMLLNFVSPQPWGEVFSSEIPKLIALWILTRWKQDEWEAWFEERGVTQESIFLLLRDLNGGDRVANHEADWVWELMMSTNPKPGEMTFALRVSIAYWLLFGKARSGLLREKLIQRVTLEKTFGSGCLRFVLVTLLFVLFTTALIFSSKGGPRRGIYNNLVSLYGLERIEEHSTWVSVREFLKSFSDASSKLAPLSERYFGSGAELSLLVEQHTFHEPVPLSEIRLWLGTGFTLQAWVHLEADTLPPKGGQSILRRAAIIPGSDVVLSCLSWNFPPALAFGGHDYGEAEPNPTTQRMEEYVMVDYPVELERRSTIAPSFVEYETMTMHTVTVNGTLASFYVNDGVLVGQARLNRPITDCAADLTTIGSRGLTLASVSFTPAVLTPAQVSESFRQGTLLGNTGYSIKRPEVRMLDSFELIEQSQHDMKTKLDDVYSDQVFETRTSAASVANSVNNPTTYPPIATSQGDDFIEPVVGTDPTLGIPSWTIFEGPTFIDVNSKNFLSGDALPKVTEDTGFAVSVWIKFDQANNGYLLGRALPVHTGNGEYDFQSYQDFCWFIYVGAGATEMRFRSKTAGIGFGASRKLADMSAPTDEQPHAKAYRHFIFQVDPQNQSNPVTICIDSICEGALWASEDMAGFPPVDCESSSYHQEEAGDATVFAGALEQSRYYIGHRPPGAWPLTGHLKSFKVFDRSLSQEQISKLFHEEVDPEDSDGGSLRKKDGCLFPEEMIDGPLFKDEFGNDCFWYYKARIAGSQNCELNPAAKRICPVACESVETCWGSSFDSSVARTMQVWRLQQEIRSKGSWGTSCIATSTTPEREAIKCGLGVVGDPEGCQHLGVRQCEPVDCSAFEHDRAALLECLGDSVWMSLGPEPPAHRFLPCAEIIRTNEPACAWDDSELDNVAAAINESKEWSLTFWFESLVTSECLQPGIRLLDGDGFTFSWLGGWKHVELDPPMGTGCNKNFWLSHALHGDISSGFQQLSEADVDIHPSYPKPGEKHLVVMAKRRDGYVVGMYDASFNADNANTFGGHPPIKRDRNFLRVVNIFGDLRMSPMTLSSVLPPTGEVARMRYSQLADESRKVGASPPYQDQLSRVLQRNTDMFTAKIFMVSPPMILQTRGKSADCPWSFSDRIISNFYELAWSRQCTAPYECQDYTKANVFQCAEGTDDQLFFGLVPQDFLDQKVYIEFLSTITDFPLVVRPALPDRKLQVMRTENFLDTLTDKVQVVTLYFSAEFGITSELSITFEAVDGTVKGSFAIKHFIALTGDSLAEFNMMQLAILIAQALLFLDNIKWAWGFRRHKIAGMKDGTQGRVFIMVLDFIIQIGAFVFFMLSYMMAADSGTKSQEYISELMALDWSSSATDFDIKKATFVDVMARLSESIAYSLSMDSFGMALAMVIFVRVIVATNAHPRIALITSTLAFAAWDVVHFMMLYMLIQWGFAIVGAWRFGPVRSDMKTVLSAMQTQFDTILDPPGDLPVSGSASEDFEYLGFVVLLHFVNFVFLVNFFLAIIIDAFNKNQKKLEAGGVEQDIISDTFEQVYTGIKSFIYRWPRKSKLLHELKSVRHRYINTEDLLRMGFTDFTQAKAFFDHYSRHDVIVRARGMGEMESLSYEQMVMHSKVKNISKTLDSLVGQSKPLGNWHLGGGRLPSPVSHGGGLADRPPRSPTSPSKHERNGPGAFERSDAGAFGGGSPFFPGSAVPAAAAAGAAASGADSGAPGAHVGAGGEAPAPARGIQFQANSSINDCQQLPTSTSQGSRELPPPLSASSASIEFGTCQGSALEDQVKMLRHEFESSSREALKDRQRASQDRERVAIMVQEAAAERRKSAAALEAAMALLREMKELKTSDVAVRPEIHETMRNQEREITSMQQERAHLSPSFARLSAFAGSHARASRPEKQPWSGACAASPRAVSADKAAMECSDDELPPTAADDDRARRDTGEHANIAPPPPTAPPEPPAVSTRRGISPRRR